MEREPFLIYIDRLRGDEVEKLVGPFDPSFLDVGDPELEFPYPVKVEGEAYLSEEHLVLRLTASVCAKMPCSVCNEMVETVVEVENHYHTELLSEIKGAIFDFSEPLREALLIEVPHYVECREGDCPQREIITPFLRSKPTPKEDTYFPFSDLH